MVDRQRGRHSVPVQMVESIMVLGQAQITTQALRLCLANSIPVHYATRSGTLLGSCMPCSEGMLGRRMRQFAAYQDEKVRLRLAKGFVIGKLSGQLALLRRYRKRVEHLAEQEAHIQKQQRKAERADEIETLLGLEGDTTRRYFANFEHMLSNIQWQGRSRMPPRDPVNALLSLSYMLMLSQISAVCIGAGFDVGVGFLHAVQSKRPSLACDVLELYRPVIDGYVIRLFNRGEIKESHFESENGGVLLEQRHFDTFIRKYDAFRPDNAALYALVMVLHRAMKQGKVPDFGENDLYGGL